MKISPSRPPLLPPRVTSASLFVVGATVGPIVDSLHNQCLLAYDMAPIELTSPLAESGPPLLASSWTVPPLLGIAYIILGYILPRAIEYLIYNPGATKDASENDYDDDDDDDDDDATNYSRRIDTSELKNKAILAVTSTAFIIKLSEYLQTHNTLGGSDFILDAQTKLEIMVASDAIQWVVLDRTPVALLAAAITAIGGPLSELPFVANGFWHYLPESADYLPLSGALFQSGGLADGLASTLLGDGYRDLALSSITGPCYFAVTTDAIALARYFYQSNVDDE